MLSLTIEGSAGTNAWKSDDFFPVYHAATPGGNAMAISAFLPRLDDDHAKVGGIFLSTGGAGGRGIDEGRDQGYPGARGGNGGAITVAVRAMPDLEFSVSALSPVLEFLSLKSVGGTGGAGGHQYGAGNGGDGGTVRLTIGGVIELPPLVTAPVTLASVGGNAGAGSWDAWRWKNPRAGNGGDVTFTLTDAGALRVTMADRTSAEVVKGGYGRAIQARSEGGNGTPSDGQPARGGNAGTVNLAINGEVSVAGSGNQAVYGLSQGGKGGDTHGYEAGNGGNAGTVALVVGESGRIETNDLFSPAVLLTARGGDGGKGLSAGALQSSFAGNGGNAAALASADSVRFLSRGEISTFMNLSPAVVLESIGGRGGDGWRTGRGGAGGNAGNIRAKNEGSITTWGRFGFGVIARSAGGLGGAGGAALAGGDGGNGGDGGALNIENTGFIQTFGQGAIAILGQSLGGGGTSSALDHLDFSLTASPATASGGAGGQASGLFSFLAKGGRGGKGGNAGDITVTNAGGVGTTGHNAPAVFLQSLGGGGGIGGSATSQSLFLAVAGGGNGGEGGNGGKITITTEAGSFITTEGLTSAGISAYSLGGGGGNAGNADASSYSMGLGLSIAIGGTGGAGGSGGNITVINRGAITTRGADSRGIELFTIGGAGGSGGQATAESVVLGTVNTPSVALSLAIGGGGGQGGDGGNIVTENHGAISTFGDQAIGIYAMSIGGGGGNGGNSAALASSVLKGKQVDIAVALGGSGGKGGTGGNITLRETAGTITTRGKGAHGVFLASVGGGGGNGGVGQGVTDAGVLATQTVGLALTVGGNGGGKGAGGDVAARKVSAAIRTTGDDAVGLLLQSIGGGGGSAYFSALTATAGVDRTKDAIKQVTQFAGAGGKAETNSNAFGTRINAAVGGKGAAAGNGGKVNVDTLASSRIETSGAAAHGIFAQSVGGGGGIGGGASTENSMSGLSATLRDYSDKVDKYGTTVYEIIKKMPGGKNIKVIPAFFVAANGDIRRRLAIDEESGKTPSVSFDFSIGGSGGAAGNGGDVDVNHAGFILTEGLGAHGIYAQSVGGGGGQGGAAASSGANALNVGLSLGATGANGGVGGSVTVTNTGSIFTRGNIAYGIQAQSVGGGGGTGGVSTPDDGEAQTGAIALGVGGNGGRQGDGGTVIVENKGFIQTEGGESHGIVAQSIGGGGGSFGLDLGALHDVGVAAAKLPSNDKGSPIGIRVNIGGNGVNGAEGGLVEVANSGRVVTTGAQAFGIFAQSVGGGGGMGAGTVSVFDPEKFSGYHGWASDKSPVSVALSLTFSGQGGEGSHGGNVYVVSNGGSSIETFGPGSIGIAAQSIGGGGGYSGSLPIDLTQGAQLLFSRAGGGGGNGGLVSIITQGGSADVITHGPDAHGLFAQSLGGGGGFAGKTAGIFGWGGLRGSNGGTGTGGPIVIDWTGRISATGRDSIGILAQSGMQLKGGGMVIGSGGKISITVDGDVTGGDGIGAAIGLDGGKDNVITIAGGTISALSGDAIRETNAALSTDGVQRIDNSGTLIGNVRTSVRTELRNLAGGVFFPGTRVDANVNNAGVTNVAGAREIGQTTVASFTQSASGVWQIDVDPENKSADRIHSKGNVKLAGKIAPVLLSPIRKPFSGIQVLTTDGTISSEAEVEGPRVLDLEVQGKEMNFTVNFNKGHAVKGLDLSENEKNAADAVQKLWNGGKLGRLRRQVLSILDISSGEQYQAALQDLAAEANAVVGASTPGMAAKMQNSLHSFPVFVGETAQLSETSGVATRYTFSYLEQSAQGQISSYRQWSNAFELNGQARFLDDWFLGGGFIYDFSALAATDGQSSATGDSFFFGGILKKILWDNLLLSASIGYSFGVFDQERDVMEVGVPRTATSDQYVHTLSSRLRAAYNFDLGKWYVRPEFGVDFVYVDIPGYRETGAGVLNMEYDPQSDFQVGLTPTLEVGGRVDFKGGILRPFGRVGLTWWSNSDWQQTSRLVAVDAMDDINTSYEAAAVIGHGEVGFDCVFNNGWEFRAQYDIDGANDFISHSVSGRFGFRF